MALTCGIRLHGIRGCSRPFAREFWLSCDNVVTAITVYQWVCAEAMPGGARPAATGQQWRAVTIDVLRAVGVGTMNPAASADSRQRAIRTPAGACPSR